MIIVEGPDGAGKSTLVRHLCKELGLTMGARSTSMRDELPKVGRRDTYLALSEAVKSDAPPTVWDRLYFSEAIYSAALGRKYSFSKFEDGFITGIMRTLGCPVIVCLPPYVEVLENVRAEHQMEGVIQNLKTIYDGYHYLGKHNGLVSKTYDYTQSQSRKPTLEGVTSYVRAYVNRRNKREWNS